MAILLLMLAIRLLILPLDAGLAHLTFYPGIALTIFLCGVAPGLLFVALASLLSAYFFFPPYGSLNLETYPPGPVGFVVSSLTIVGIIQLFRREAEKQHRRLLNEMAIRQRAEQGIAETGIRLAGIIESAMDAIISVDAGQRIVLFNPAAEELFGYSASEILGDSIEKLIPERFLLRHAEHMHRFANGRANSRKVASSEEQYALRRDGSEFPIEASISRTTSENGPIFTIILRDISERHATEKLLNASRKQMATLIEQAPVCIAMLDRDMNYIATSRQWLAVYGRGFFDLVGLNHYEVNPDIPEAWKEIHRNALAGKVARNEQDMWIQEDGTRHWLRWAIHSWTDETGNIGGVILSAEDITRPMMVEMALRASEDDLLRAQAVGNIGSWRLDIRRDELTWSAQSYQIFGIPEGTPLSYGVFLAQVHPDDRHYVDAMWQAALTGKPYHIEHRLLVDGQVKWVIEKAELEFDTQGTLIGGFGITQDITGRHLMEDQLKEARDRLATLAAERAAHLLELSGELTWAEQRERDRLYELLHDHVQPLLVGVRLGLSGIGKNTHPEETLRIVTEANEQISRVIQTARTLSVELNPPLIRERGLIPALESLCRWVQANHGLTVDMDCAPYTEPASTTIRLLCFKATRELLMNVVKYAATRHAVIDLKRLPANILCITVQDQGVGFDPTAGYEGSGLANIERRLNMVGGSLTVHSSRGAGTKAMIHVPLDMRAEVTGQSRPRPLHAVNRRRNDNPDPVDLIGTMENQVIEISK